MGHIWLYMFCPLKSPKRAASAFGRTSVSGEKEKWKKMEKRRVSERGQTRSFTHIYPLGSRKCQGMHHAVSRCLVGKRRERRAVHGRRAAVGIRRAAAPLRLANSRRKQGRRDASSPPTVARTPRAVSLSPADIISF